MPRGNFITFEGGEGSGKSTQISLLSDSLTKYGIVHIVTREPGGTDLAEKIRPLLVKEQGNEDWDPRAETLLFLAARIQHWHHKIYPALEKGQWVLCDRFVDSTLVYQGVGKELGLSWVKDLHEQLLPDALPDVTLLLDIEPQIGLSRAQKRHDDETRFESLTRAFHQSLRQGFSQLAAESDGRIKTIDASNDIKTIENAILEVIKERFSL